jgi:hypothetical protein
VRRTSIVVLVALASAASLFSFTARAQMPGAGAAGGGRPGQGAPTQSSPVQNVQVGPRSGGDDDQQIQVTQRSEPSVAPPANPLEISKEARDQIGTDYTGGAAPDVPRSFHTVPPFWFEHTRGVGASYDRESLYGLLYYQRRSLKLDRDVLFPLFWHMRDDQAYTTVVGPVLHREAPGENDNWLAPLYFTGSRPDGGYFHSPALLTTSHWNAKGAFTLSLLYFRDRTGTDVDAGVVPFYFHGDNGDVEGNRKSYTLIPPLLYFHRERELEGSKMTVIGPVLSQSDTKRDIFDVAPLFFHIKGKPESGGVREEHTTLFPFFHYGWSEENNTSLFVIPGYLRRTTKDADTMLTPIYSHATTRSGATSMTAVGPVVPLWFDYRDRDVGTHAWALAPFYYTSDSPAGHDWLTPLVGRFETYGLSKTWWIFPSFTATTDTQGWSANIYPFFFTGRNDKSSHTVVAPFFWDFADPKSRVTIAAPLFWRFGDNEGSVTQVALNTVYIQRPAPGGLDWQFHFAPLFSYGENPTGYFWNILFGLAGYTRAGSYAEGRAFWVPFTLSGTPPGAPQTAQR